MRIESKRGTNKGRSRWLRGLIAAGATASVLTTGCTVSSDPVSAEVRQETARTLLNNPDVLTQLGACAAKLTEQADRLEQAGLGTIEEPYRGMTVSDYRSAAGLAEYTGVPCQAPVDASFTTVVGLQEVTIEPEHVFFEVPERTGSQ